MTTLTVTATQGGSTANGIILRIFVITGAKPVANQTGGALNLGFASNTNAWTGSVTTTSGSNFYGGASMSGSGNSPTGTSVTIVDTTSDTTNAETYVTFKALNVTSGATTRGIQASPAAAGTLGAFEVLAATTLAEDGSAPVLASTTSAITVTSASFTPPPGSLLVAIPVSDGGASATTMTVTDNLAVHLNWTQKTSNPAAGEDYAGVWMADVPAAAAGGIPQAQPGQTWLRAFHHRQVPPVPPGTVTAAPVTGPPVYPLGHPVRAQPASPFLSGRAGWRSGTFTAAAVASGPPVYPLRNPVRAQLAAPFLAGRADSRTGPFGGTGPPVRPLHHPAAAPRTLPPAGRAARRTGPYGGTGNPIGAGGGPVQAQALPQRGGRIQARAGTFTAFTPNAGAPVYPLHHPVTAPRTLPPRGRIIRVAGTYAGTGPAPVPLRRPAGIWRQQPPPPAQGRTASRTGPYAGTGPPVIRQRRTIRGQPQKPLLTGRAGWRAGTYTFIAPPAFQVARSTPAVTDPVTSAPSVADPRDGTNTVTDLATSSPAVS